MPPSTLETNALMRQIRSEYEKQFNHEPSREEIEKFVSEAFRSRNVRPTPSLLAQTVEHLITGSRKGDIEGKNIRPC